MKLKTPNQSQNAAARAPLGISAYTESDVFVLAFIDLPSNSIILVFRFEICLSIASLSRLLFLLKNEKKLSNQLFSVIDLTFCFSNLNICSLILLISLL